VKKVNFKKFNDQGFLEEFHVDVGIKLENLQNKIYVLTKDLIVDHDSDLNISDKLNLPFKLIPKNEVWSNIMTEINNSNELNDIINHEEIINSFRKIFKNPLKFPISAFRARFPNQKRVLYSWHQDEGTWFLSKDSNLQKKLSGTLWFSINGSNEDDSIQLIKYSHKNGLFDHKYIKGQGYFSANLDEQFDQNFIYTVKTQESEAVLFHPLTLHRSVAQKNKTINMRPRYSIDIRYYDNNVELNYKTNKVFKLKKYFKNLW